AEIAPQGPPPAAAAPAAPVPVAAVTAPAGSDASEPSRNARGDAEAGGHRTVSIPPGASILSMARQLFGELADNRAFLAEVRRLNPELHDVNVVMAGAVVRFPSSPSGRSESGGQVHE